MLDQTGFLKGKKRFRNIRRFINLINMANVQQHLPLFSLIRRRHLTISNDSFTGCLGRNFKVGESNNPMARIKVTPSVKTGLPFVSSFN